jgi:anti-sigma B factor antagonist
MPIHIRVEGDVVVLSNFGRLMDDPRHFDAPRDVKEMLDQGFKRFVIELRGVGDMGSSGLGLLMTITRTIRQHGGEVVLAAPSRGMRNVLEEMQMEEFWDVYPNVEEAGRSWSGEGT